jgi:hypothetical protein
MDVHPAFCPDDETSVALARAQRLAYQHLRSAVGELFLLLTAPVPPSVLRVHGLWLRVQQADAFLEGAEAVASGGALLTVEVNADQEAANERTR